LQSLPSMPLANNALGAALFGIVALSLSTAGCSSQLNSSGGTVGASGGTTGAAGSGVGGTGTGSGAAGSAGTGTGSGAAGSPGDGGSPGAGGGSGAGGGAGEVGGAGRGGWCTRNNSCAPGLGCVFPCISETGAGYCAVLPAACDAVAAPVCGCDDNTYANTCLLDGAPAEKAYDGACVVTPVGNGRDATLVAGVWSGTGIRMVVTSSGATVSFRCMQGTIDQPLIFGPRSFWGGYRYSGTLQGMLTSSGDGGMTTSAATYELGMDRDAVILYVNTPYGTGPSWLLRLGDQGPPSCP